MAAIRAAKGRPGLAVPVLVPRIPTVSGIARPSAVAYQLMRDFWPGQLTLMLPAQPTLMWSLTDAAGRVAVRQPLHPVALELLEETGPLAVIGASAPAEDPSSAFPPELAEQLTVILDGGPLPGGPPSTVVDLSVEPPVLVREGAVTARAAPCGQPRPRRRMIRGGPPLQGRPGAARVPTSAPAGVNVELPPPAEDC